MLDPYTRIQEHLGTALRKLTLFEDRAAGGHDTSRDADRCLADLQRVAREVEQAFDALKGERQRLTAVAADADATMRRARQLFVQTPSACLILHRDGAAIADANAAATRLLNVSRRYLIGRAFTHFLQQDREVFLRHLQGGAGGASDQWHVLLRPRERALVRVLVKAVGDNEDTAAIVLSPAINGTLMDESASSYAEA